MPLDNLTSVDLTSFSSYRLVTPEVLSGLIDLLPPTLLSLTLPIRFHIKLPGLSRFTQLEKLGGVSDYLEREDVEHTWVKTVK